MISRISLRSVLALLTCVPCAAVAQSPSAVRVINKSPSRCPVFRNLKNTLITNLTVGPCPNQGITIDGGSNITIRNVTVTGTGQSGIYVIGARNVNIQESRISNAVTGVTVLDSKNVHVDCNTIQDVRGPIPAGQLVQFNNVHSAGNRISCNVGRNSPKDRPEDAISLFQSSGGKNSPIEVHDNLIIGGGPSQSGGGIMLGDGGGSYQSAHDNVLVDPGQYGVAVSSGRHMSIVRNKVFSRRHAWTNVGISVWNQYSSACADISVQDNRVNWMNSANRENPFWDGENCGRIRGVNDNIFPDPKITARIQNAAPHDCSCKRAGRIPPKTAAQ